MCRGGGRRGGRTAGRAPWPLTLRSTEEEGRQEAPCRHYDAKEEQVVFDEQEPAVADAERAASGWRQE